MTLLHNLKTLPWETYQNDRCFYTNSTNIQFIGKFSNGVIFNHPMSFIISTSLSNFNLVYVRHPSCTPLWFWIWIGYSFLSISWWLDRCSLKQQRKLSKKILLNKRKETRVKFTPGLSANRPSNNWAQGFQEVCRTIPPAFSRSIRRGKVVTWLQKGDIVRGNVKGQLWSQRHRQECYSLYWIS